MSSTQINFKSALAAFCTCLLASITASSAPMIWPDQETQFVSIAAEPTLTVTLQKLDTGERAYYASLQVSLSYTTQASRQAYLVTSQGFPGYAIQNVLLEKSGQYHYRLPTLGIESDIDLSPGAEGPYFDDIQYLTSLQYRQVLGAMQSKNPVATLEGKVSGNVPLMKTIEQRELDATTCEKLAPSGATLKTLLERSITYGLPTLMRIPIQHPETLIALMNDIEKNCFELIPQLPVHSFSDLLSAQVQAKNPGRNLHGEFKTKTLERKTLPLTYQLIQNSIPDGAK